MISCVSVSVTMDPEKTDEAGSHPQYVDVLIDVVS
jgi:hypothetical protein